MQRDLEEISDGKIYNANDMVRASCNDCEGCSSCCEDMGDSVRLDPMDLYRLTTNLNKTFEELLQGTMELGVENGLVLPNLKMADQNHCTFLNEQGRCSIHAFRPGVCRLFPLGRIYEAGKVSYILQTHECKKENRTKVKVSKWLDMPELKKYEQYELEWYQLRKEAEKIIAAQTDENLIRSLNMFLLNNFFMKPYEAERDFYEQFAERRQLAYQILRA